MGYTNTDKMLHVWDFEQKVFVNSCDFIFFETQFPKASDFDKLPADPYNRSTSFSSPKPLEPLPIYDEIIVQLEVIPPLALHSFMTYGDFQLDNGPPSFIDAMRRPDTKLWWDAFWDEIKAVITWNTSSLICLLPGRCALPMR